MYDFQCDLSTLVRNVLWLMTQFWNFAHHLPPIPYPTHRKFLHLIKYFCMLCLATHFNTGWKNHLEWANRISSNQREARGPIFYEPLSCHIGRVWFTYAGWISEPKWLTSLTSPGHQARGEVAPLSRCLAAAQTAILKPSCRTLGAKVGPRDTFGQKFTEEASQCVFLKAVSWFLQEGRLFQQDSA